MAVVSVNKNKIHRLSEQGNKNAALIERLMRLNGVPVHHPGGHHSGRLFLQCIGGYRYRPGAGGTDGAVEPARQPDPGRRCGDHHLAYFNLVFGELVPKRIALQKAEAFSLFCVRPIYYISRIMNPFIKLLSLSTSGFLKLIGMHNENLETDVSEEEIKSMLETGSEAGVFNDIEKEMITSIFSFDDKKAKEVMVPRQDMVALDINEPLEEFLDEILESMHSKIPVYEGEIDNIIGVLSTKALTIEARRTSFDKLDVRTLLKPAYFVPENRRTDALFREMQANKIKLAILIDEYGGVSGMVTLEDLIEEIVGDIHEEYEEEEPELTELEPHKVYRVSGGITLFDLKEEMHLHMDSSCDTLSGYLMEQLGYIPSREQLPLTVVTPEADYEILEVEDRVIEWVKLTLKETKKEQEE